MTKSSQLTETKTNLSSLTCVSPHAAYDKLLQPIQYNFTQRCIAKQLPNAAMFTFLTICLLHYRDARKLENWFPFYSFPSANVLFASMQTAKFYIFRNAATARFFVVV